MNEQCETMGLACKDPTVIERLNSRIQRAEEELSAMKRAKEILAKQPEIKELLDCLRSVGI